MTVAKVRKVQYAIIDGSGFEPTSTEGELMTTPYGEPSAPLRRVQRGGHDVIWLPRHGDSHVLPPHLVNYRANLYALQQAGVTHVIGINTVGVITDCVAPGDLAVPALEQYLRQQDRQRVEQARAYLALGRARFLRGENERAEAAFVEVTQRSEGPLAAEAQFRIGETRQKASNLQGAVEAYVKLPILYAHAELSLIHI